MKKLVLFASVLVAVSFASCGNKAAEEAAAAEAQRVADSIEAVRVADSIAAAEAAALDTVPADSVAPAM